MSKHAQASAKCNMLSNQLAASMLAPAASSACRQARLSCQAAVHGCVPILPTGVDCLGVPPKGCPEALQFAAIQTSGLQQKLLLCSCMH